MSKQGAKAISIEIEDEIEGHRPEKIAARFNRLNTLREQEKFNFNGAFSGLVSWLVESDKAQAAKEKEIEDLKERVETLERIIWGIPKT